MCRNGKAIDMSRDHKSVRFELYISRISLNKRELKMREGT
jgi:hypothetical protein